MSTYLHWAEKALWCFDRARFLGVKNILILNKLSLMAIGISRMDLKSANDNKAKP